MWAYLKRLIDQNITRHFREAHAPVENIALGTAIGMFWALTPLVGIQMMLVTGTWVIFRVLRLLPFYLPVGLAMVWLSNPLTMPFMYYGFYIAGYALGAIFVDDLTLITYSLFEQTLLQAQQMDLIDGIILWIKFMLYRLGWPMLIGGFAIGVPFAIITYPVTLILVNRHRRRVAAKSDMTLKQWEEKHVRPAGNVFGRRKQHQNSEK